jgi:hypothetical protein
MMRNKVWLDYFKAKLFLILAFQGVALFVSLPLMVSYGLGISRMSIVGNIVFYPILALIIFVSSLKFIASVFGFNALLLAHSLNALSAAWDCGLSLGSADWVFYFSFLHLACFYLVMTLMVVVLRIYSRSFFKTFFIWIFPLMMFFSISVIRARINHFFLEKHQLKLEKKSSSLFIRMSHSGAAVRLFDWGYLSRFHNARNLVVFTIAPEVAKSFGVGIIEEIVIGYVGKNFVSVVCELQKMFVVRKIVLQQRRGKKMQNAVFDLQKVCLNSGIDFVLKYDVFKGAVKI